MKNISIEASVDQYLAPFVRMNDFSGAVLVARNGEILVRKGYGMANYEFSIPNGPQIKFHIASLAKTFTAAVIVLLEEQNLVKFDDTLSKFVLDFPISDKIKILHLLTHSAGIPDFYSLPEYEELKTKPMALADWIALLKTKPLDFEPGQRNSYSNSGYALLAFVIEKVLGKSYEEFLRERILTPLKMDNTGILDDTNIINNYALGYEPWTGQQGVIRTPYYDKTVLAGSGSLYSTVDDLYLWYSAIREEKLFSIRKLAYPYGWGVRERFGHELIEQDGSNPGYVAHISAYLKDDFCIIVLSNIRTGVLARIKVDLAAILLKKHYEMPMLRDTVDVDPKVLGEYVGSYQVSTSMTLTVKTDGKVLYLKGTGGYFLPLEPLSEIEFFYRQLYVSLIFERDDTGKVIQLLWEGKHPFSKISD